MAQGNWRDPELTPEEKVARLVLARAGEWPPVNVRRIAAEFATVEEAAFKASCDAITIREPGGRGRQRILLNTNSTTYEPRKRFSLSHEVGHIKIPWHCGSIACHINEENASLSGNHLSDEGEANRFASELLMPTDWVQQVIDEEQTIKKIFTRIVDSAEVSRPAARIKLLKNLPPGYVYLEYNRSSGQIERIEESRNGCLSLFIEQGDRASVARLTKALEFHAVDGYQFQLSANIGRWWRLDSRCEVPVTQMTHSSVDILRGITEDVYETRDLQNKTIFVINGYASDGYQKAPIPTEDGIYGAIKLRFAKQEVKGKAGLGEAMAHPLWGEYLIAKARELANGETSRKKPARSKKWG